MPPRQNRLAMYSLLAAAPPALFWAMAAWATVAGDGSRKLVTAVAGIPPHGFWLVTLLIVFPLVSFAIGTAGRMQANRRGQLGDFLGFVSVGLATVLLPAALLAFSVGMR